MKSKNCNERICRDANLLFVTDFQRNYLSVRWIKTMERDARIDELYSGEFHRKFVVVLWKLWLGDKSVTAASSWSNEWDFLLLNNVFKRVSYFVYCIFKNMHSLGLRRIDVSDEFLKSTNNKKILSPCLTVRLLISK